MSFQYDQYLARHRANVKRGFDWLSEIDEAEYKERKEAAKARMEATDGSK